MYNPQNQQHVSHFMGVVVGADGIPRPDVTSFLVLSQHPVRVLLRDVRAEVRLDTLDSLIETIKRLTDRVYRARLSGETTFHVAQKSSKLTIP